MNRPLLHSEVALLLEGGAVLHATPMSALRVLAEYHSQPQVMLPQWFNTDFYIELADREERMQTPRRKGGRAIPVHPLTLGAEYFVIVSEAGRPLTLELLNGESIRQSTFRDELEWIDEVLRNIRDLPRPISVANAPYLRVARLQTCVPFVVATTTSISDLLSAPAVELDTSKGQASYHVLGDQLLIDGVLFD